MSYNGDEIIKINALLIGNASGKYPGAILPPLSASAQKGELVAVIGRNGIGKSTLLRTIPRLQPAIGGTVLIYGENTSIFSRHQLAQKIGYISTEIVKVGHMRVYDLVALGRFPYTNWIGRIGHHDHSIIKEALQKTGLIDFENRLVGEISDGERQRAMIARVLAQNTDIMIMDEPTAFLDISGKYEIINLMRELTKAGRTIIFSTHDLNIAIKQADKIWLMHEKDIIEGSPEDLLLRNAFDRLFDSELVGFNPDDGSINLKAGHCGKIFLEGEETVRHWTVKALARAGFSVTDVKMIPYIRIDSDPDEWILFTEASSERFRSLYDLVSRLNNGMKKFT